MLLINKNIGNDETFNYKYFNTSNVINQQEAEGLKDFLIN